MDTFNQVLGKPHHNCFLKCLLKKSTYSQMQEYMLIRLIIQLPRKSTKTAEELSNEHHSLGQNSWKGSQTTNNNFNKSTQTHHKKLAYLVAIHIFHICISQFSKTLKVFDLTVKCWSILISYSVILYKSRGYKQ